MGMILSPRVPKVGIDRDWVALLSNAVCDLGHWLDPFYSLKL